MATIDVIMPQMGESIAEGTLSRWMKKVGESVKRDEPIFEISTVKVDAEIPAPAAGVLSEILVQEGLTVAVQTGVARIDTEAAAGAAKPAPSRSEGPAAPAPAPAAAAPAPAPPKAAPAPPPPAPAPAPSAPAPAARPAAEKARPGQVAEGNGEMETAEERLRRRSTPLVRKMAAEHGLDLTEIPGTGLAGRVTKNDVLGYIDSGGARRGAGAQPPAAPLPEPVAATAPQPRAPAPAVEPWEGDRVEPWSRIRKLTAEHMVMSRRVSPHVNTVFEIDYSRIAQIRARKKQEYADRGVNLTFLAFIAKAVADALRRHPVVNSAVSGESTILRR